MSRKKRSQNLNTSDIEKIVGILDGWVDGKMTWATFLSEVAKRLNRRYTKQALYKHERIYNAFMLTQKRLGGEHKTPQRPVSREMQIVLDINTRLKIENERIKSENNKLLEQSVVWAKNAYDHGLTLEMLNRPLSPVNRGQTKNKR